MQLGSKTVVETLALIEKGNVVITIQKENQEIKTAYKLDKDNCKIDWTKSGSEIHNLIRGLSPYPTAWCIFKDDSQEWNVKIYEALFDKAEHSESIGKIVSNKKELKVAVLGGFLSILSLQFPGKKKMTTHELLNGMTFSENTKVC
jgi:methionyl-tRNA formyltransferase